MDGQEWASVQWQRNYKNGIQLFIQNVGVLKVVCCIEIQLQPYLMNASRFMLRSKCVCLDALEHTDIHLLTRMQRSLAYLHSTNMN